MLREHESVQNVRKSLVEFLATATKSHCECASCSNFDVKKNKSLCLFPTGGSEVQENFERFCFTDKL